MSRFRVTGIDDTPFPLEVDGDFVGEFSEAVYEVAPGSLSVVS
jgi:hypothetical protein